MSLSCENASLPIPTSFVFTKSRISSISLSMNTLRKHYQRVTDGPTDRRTGGLTHLKKFEKGRGGKSSQSWKEGGGMDLTLRKSPIVSSYSENGMAIGY